MKHIIHFLNYLFRPRGQIIIVLLFFNTITTAQESTPPEEFPVGTSIGESLINTPGMFERFVETDLNTIYQRADDNTNTLLEDYNLLAWNSESEFEYIYHYSSSYYSKWEAEQNQTDLARVGVKHTSGDTATWKGNLCWSTKNYSSIPDGLLMFGPHYYQDKTYKRVYPFGWRKELVRYTVRFKMALENTDSVPGSEDVCIIKVVYRYKDVETGDFYETVFLERTLKVQDFDPNGLFDLFDFEGATYDYDDQFNLPENFDKLIDPPAGTITYTDIESYTGIQYVVDWLRDDDDCTLYIDYVEVYDNKGWNDFIFQPEETANKIKAYADSFKTMGWTNIKFWGGMDEPSTIDAYAPIHIVDSIIRSVPAPPMINTFNPLWTWDHLINGEVQMSQFISIAQPSKLLLAVNPCTAWNELLTFNEIDWLRHNLQLASGFDSNFWFAAQTHGLLVDTVSHDWCVWRKPEPPELK